MQLADIKTAENKGNGALKRLRRMKLEKGQPFMINAKNLPSNQCYLEYADGKIVLVTILSPTARDFTVIRELSSGEKKDVLERYDLS